MVEALAKSRYDDPAVRVAIYGPTTIHMGITVPEWDTLDAGVQHQIREGVRELVKPILPIVEAEIDKAGVVATVLRGRLEMYVNELQARGEYTVAAELDVIINAPLED
jgi:hypothetical protein